MRRRTFVVTQRSLWAREEALRLMARHGLHDWVFAFNGARRRAGVCFYPHGNRPGVIGLSVHYCERNVEAEILNTILHEIAHALAGPGHGHDATWKAVCRRVGARPERCYDASAVDMPRGRWRARCPGCGQDFHRHRRPRTLTGWHCKKCGRSKGQIVWVYA